jgi:type II secretory pathway component PulK
MSQLARYQRRTGAALAIALTMLAVTGLFVGAMLRQFVVEQRQMKARHHQWQAQWLARSAVERGRAQLTYDPQYRGETWEPPLGDQRAEVVIEIPADAEEAERVLSVAANFPAEHPLRARCDLAVPISSDRAAAERSP